MVFDCESWQHQTTITQQEIRKLADLSSLKLVFSSLGAGVSLTGSFGAGVLVNWIYVSSFFIKFITLS